MDAKRGLVVVDRNTTPISLGDVIVTVAASVEIPGRIVYLHEVHNVAVVQYDPKLLGNTPVRSAVLATEALSVGDSCNFVGITSNSTTLHQKCRVTKHEELFIRDSIPPRFRAHNADVLHFDLGNRNVATTTPRPPTTVADADPATAPPFVLCCFSSLMCRRRVHDRRWRCTGPVGII